MKNLFWVTGNVLVYLGGITLAVLFLLNVRPPEQIITLVHGYTLFVGLFGGFLIVIYYITKSPKQPFLISLARYTAGLSSLLIISLVVVEMSEHSELILRIFYMPNWSITLLAITLLVAGKLSKFTSQRQPVDDPTLQKIKEVITKARTTENPTQLPVYIEFKRYSLLTRHCGSPMMIFRVLLNDGKINPNHKMYQNDLAKLNGEESDDHFICSNCLHNYKNEEYTSDD